MPPTPEECRRLQSWGVSRETLDRLAVYESLIARWVPVKNLIAPSTANSIWQRHFIDSAQVRQLCPNAKRWVDIGSGAGFPGLVLAILMSGSRDVSVDLVEADHRKCAFLRHVSRETNANARVHHGRIEDILPALETPDVVTARALAPMDLLLEWTGEKIQNGATGLFLKGQDIAQELTLTTKSSRFNIELIASQTSPTARIVIVTGRSDQHS